MLPYFSSLPLDDMVAIRSSKVLPHRLLLVMVLSASFPFFFSAYKVNKQGENIQP